jgi:multidrug efflux pump subunit AcrA (membrane-fusion protein)
MMTLVLVVALAAGCVGAKSTEPEKAPIPADDSSLEEPTPIAAVRSAGNVVLMDGELVTVYPSLRLAFSGNISAQVKTLDVEIGQRVKAGDLIAVLDDAELNQAVIDAELALERAQEDLAQAEQDAEENYRDAIEDAQDKYDQEREDSQEQYDRELKDAEQALENAQSALQRAKMQPPTLAVEEAKVNLDRALDAEADAEDNYKQALDRPWENQSIRDSYFEEWQTRIVDRQLSELRYQDALLSFDVYRFDLGTKERDVRRAEETLDKVELDTVEMDEVDKEDDFTTYERAIEDAEERLADAQNDLQDVYLYAPWNGLITSIDTSVGATISSGTAVVTLLNVDELYFVTENLSERHVAQLQTGQQANITLRTFPETIITGKVEVIVPNEERQTDADARFTAYIRLDPSELDLLPGMTGRVEIVTDQP